MVASKFRLLQASLSERGVVGTVAAILSTVRDMVFDLRWGTDTQSRVEVDGLVIDGNTKLTNHYQPTGVALFNKAISLLPASTQDGAFVDFGSGKGRALLLAAQAGFSRVVGVEFSPDLCAIARKNIETYRERTNSMVQFEIVEIDACQYDLRSDENVFFFFNPFQEPIVAAVFANIRRSLIESPRRVWIVYVNPLFESVFLSKTEVGLRKVVATTVLGYRLAVYTNESAWRHSV